MFQKIICILVLFSVGVFLNCASAGDTFKKGMAAHARRDYATALKQWHPLAEHGYATAQNNLGEMHRESQNVSQDYKEAVEWYRKAAEQGDALAQNNLGEMYYEGQGVPQDYKEAVKWYRKAAGQGHALGQNNLGEMYARGHGVQRDYVISLMWFNLAAKNGFQPAIQFRDSADKFLTPAQIEEAERLAREGIAKRKKEKHRGKERDSR